MVVDHFRDIINTRISNFYFISIDYFPKGVIFFLNVCLLNLKDISLY